MVCDVGLFIGATGSVLCMCVCVCLSGYIYCGRCIKSAFTKDEGKIKGL